MLIRRCVVFYVDANENHCKIVPRGVTIQMNNICVLQDHASESIRITVVDIHTTVGVYFVYCGGVFAYCGGEVLLWWVMMLNVVGYYAQFGGLLCLMWWRFLRTVVDSYC